MQPNNAHIRMGLASLASPPSPRRAKRVGKERMCLGKIMWAHWLAPDRGKSGRSGPKAENWPLAARLLSPCQPLPRSRKSTGVGLEGLIINWSPALALSWPKNSHKGRKEGREEEAMGQSSFPSSLLIIHSAGQIRFPFSPPVRPFPCRQGLTFPA